MLTAALRTPPSGACCPRPTSRGSSTSAPAGTPAAAPGSGAARRPSAAMRDYQPAAIELGYLHHRYLRGTAPADFARARPGARARICAVRPYISFPGQVVPTR